MTSHPNHRHRSQSQNRPSLVLKTSDSNSSTDSTPSTPDLLTSSPDLEDTPPQSTPTPFPSQIDPLPGPTSGSGKSGTNKKDVAPKPEKAPALPGELSPVHKKIAEQLAQSYAGIGMLLMGVNPNAGKILYMGAFDRATEVVKVARHHPAMLKIVKNIINGNDYMGLAVGHLSMLGAILAVSGRLPDNNMTAVFKFQGLQLVHMFNQVHQQAAGESLNGNISEAGLPVNAAI